MGACADIPPPSESQVVRFVVDDHLQRLGDVMMALAPSDCGTAGETGSAIPAALFSALLAVNDAGLAGLDAAALPPRLRVDGDLAPRLLSARRGEPVVALSRAGINGNAALICVEVFAAEERGFFLLLERDGRGQWSVRSEFEAWSEGDPPPWEREPEELPDGTPYVP